MSSSAPTEVVPLACYRRKRYATERDVMSVVYRIRASGTDRIGAFKCDDCGQWHLRREELGKT